jgi:hypothetical protein
MHKSIPLALSLALLFVLASGCASQPVPPPEAAPPPEPMAAPAVQPETPPPAQPQAPPPRDPSQPPPEVEAGCLPECTMVAGKCQALVHPGPINDEQEPETIGPGPKPAEKLVKPCAAHCCRGQD